MNHVALEQPFFMRSCQTYWRNPQGKICHCSLICWKTIRNYVKCTKKQPTPESVIKASRGFRADQLTVKGAGFNSWRGENWAQEKRLILIIWNLPAAFFLFAFSGNVYGGSADEHCPNEGCESTGSNWTGLWDYWTDYRTIIGQKSQPCYRCSWMTGTQKVGQE